MAGKRHCTLRTLGKHPPLCQTHLGSKDIKGLLLVWAHKGMLAGVLASRAGVFYPIIFDFRSMFRHDHLHFLSRRRDRRTAKNRQQFLGCHRRLGAVCAILTFATAEHLADHQYPPIVNGRTRHFKMNLVLNGAFAAIVAVRPPNLQSKFRLRLGYI